MKNFIFKSKDFGLTKNVSIELKLNHIQMELRHQRSDNVEILRQLRLISHNYDLQQTVDKYYDEDEHSTIGPPSTQGTIPEDSKDIPEEEQ